MSLRVLHLLRALRVGGLEDVVVNLVNGMESRGLACHVGCLLEKGPWMERVRPQGVWVGNLEQVGPTRAVWSLAGYLRRNRIEVLHTHNSQAHLLGVAARCLSGVPVVHTKHGQNWPDDPRWVWKSRQASRLTRTIVAVSKDIERIVTEIERVPPGKVRTVRNGVDLARFDRPAEARFEARSRIRRSAGIPDDAMIVGSVGRLAWEKNYEWLVQTFAVVARDVPEARLVLVGEGPYRSRIEAAVEAAGLQGRCILAGQQAAIDDWLAAMDVFVLSSLTEGTSITLLEASAAGLPCVVTDVGGNAEIVRDGVSGAVVPPSDGEALARALKELCADAALRARCGQAARNRVARDYSAARMVDEYLAIYGEAAGRAAGSASGPA